MSKNIGAHILEIIWLIVALVAIGLGVKITFEKGIAESYPLFIIFVVSLLMFIFRRNKRRAN